MSNGFSNHDTEQAVMWLANDEDRYIEMHTTLHRYDIYSLGDSGVAAELRDEIAPLVEDIPTINPENVVWGEVIHHFHDDVVGV